MTKQETRTGPALWFGCLAAYNAGTLHGKWLYLDNYADADELRAAIKREVLDTSPEPDAEEYAAMDNDIMAGLDIGEYPDLDELYKFLDEAADIDEDILEAALACSDDWDEAIEMARDNYAGQFDNPADFAADLLESTGELDEIPERFQFYFDFDGYGRDLILNGDVHEHDGHYFWTR